MVDICRVTGGVDPRPNYMLSTLSSLIAMYFRTDTQCMQYAIFMNTSYININ